VKPLDEVQRVQVRPGQRRSGQAGSECCHSSGDWRVRSVHSEEAGREDSAPKSVLIAMPTPLAWWKAVSGQPIGEVVAGSPESLARGMLTQGLSVNPGELPTPPECGLGYAQPKGTRSPGNEGCPEGSEAGPRRGETCRQGKPEAAATGGRAVLRVHSTDEGGEPQGSRARGGHGIHWREGTNRSM